MVLTYTTRAGDMLDRVCHAHYGREDHLAKVYDANPGLAAFGNTLPYGLSITLPDLAPPRRRATQRLWGTT